MSSLLASFGRDGSIVALDTRDHSVAENAPLALTDLVKVAGRSLPILSPESLKFESNLGYGTSSLVSREILINTSDSTWSPYYVAVKRMPKVGLTRKEYQRRCNGLTKELRVMSHARLKDHECIIPALAYGWEDGPLQLALPFVVVEYSDHGSMSDYLKRIRPNFQERREFALDVAAGLQALHECKIIHGDLKPANILITNCDHEWRVQSARLADFGAAIFELDTEVAYYVGTSLYNAPEVQIESRNNNDGSIKGKKIFYAADVYSLGLTLWEIMANGTSFVQESWLKPGESPRRYLDRLCLEETDGLLSRAELFIQSTDFKELDSSLTPILRLFRQTLRDDPISRSEIGNVVADFAVGTTEKRPPSNFPTIKTLPLGKELLELTKPESPGGVPRAARGQTLVLQPSRSMAEYEERRNAGLLRKKDAQEQKLAPSAPSRPPPPKSAPARSEEFDIFQLSVFVRQPWHMQQQIVQRLERLSIGSDSSEDRADACLQLALCHFLGFGLPQNRLEFLRLLGLASYGSFVAQAIVGPVNEAFGDEFATNSRDTYITPSWEPYNDTKSSPTYFAIRIRMCQRAKAQHMRNARCSFAGKVIDLKDIANVKNVFGSSSSRPATTDMSTDQPGITTRNICLHLAATGNAKVLGSVLQSYDFNKAELSAILKEAFMYGQFATAKLLARFCREFVADETEPCPLHWLIMFDSSEMIELIRLLLLKVPGESREHQGSCATLINYMPSAGDGTFFFPEHCLQLFGAPLHWAVRTRNVALTEALLHYGALIDRRWQGRRQWFGDLPVPLRPWTSPLDLAVQFHMPEMTDLLILRGAPILGSTVMEEHLCLHMIGVSCIPLARYIVHGKLYRQALTDTIDVLHSKYHLSVDDPDPNGNTALLIALADQDHEIYMVEEILAAKPEQSMVNSSGASAISLIIRGGAKKSIQTTTLEILGPLVYDVNGSDDTGRNALHECAILDNKALIKVLLQMDGIQVDARATSGATALHFAATHGGEDVSELLLNARADLSLEDDCGYTALELAITNRRLATALILLDRGAETAFRRITEAPKGLFFPSPETIALHSALPRSTALHGACAGATRESSMVEQLLESSERLRRQDALDAFNSCGWTPLHQAVYYGDHQAVIHLVKHGADVTKLSILGKPQTAAMLALEMSDKLSSGKLGINHQRIIERGPAEIRRLAQKFEEIRLTLENASSTGTG